MTNTSHRKQGTFLHKHSLHWLLLPTKMYNRTLLFAITLFKHGRHFDYWNQPLNMRMRVCYLHCHEAGLCCCLVIHTETLLRPLQLFYFHLWHIYWLSRVICSVHCLHCWCLAAVQRHNHCITYSKLAICSDRVERKKIAKCFAVCSCIFWKHAYAIIS
jgi:hypothetical protein